MIKILGTLKGVNLKSKEDNDGRIIHSIALSFELVEGVEKAQEILERIKQIVEVQLIDKQPTLG